MLWLLVLLYAVARVLQAFPDRIPTLAIFLFHVVPPLLFALVHGARRYGLRGILVFVGLCLTIGNVLENVGVLTGVPFGRYHFTAVMGPKLFEVPILLGMAYIGIGYVSWVLGLLMVGDIRKPLAGSRVVTVPLVAAFVMVAWDLSMDPVWANLVHGWVWHNGGAYFGVPVSNFLGWYLTIYLIYQSFALYLRNRPAAIVPQPSTFWLSAVAFYAVCAAGNLFVMAAPSPKTVTDAAGTVWTVNGIFGASAIVSIFVMGAFAVLAWTRTWD
jgi:uncharacterized membrane protein